MHELGHVKISHTCILQRTYTTMLYAGTSCCITLVCVIMLYASFGLGQGLHIWHTMGQVLPAAIRGAFQ